MKSQITCENIEHLIYLKYDELDTLESTLLSQHLETCTSCKEKQENFLAVRKSILASQEITEYPDFTKTVAIRRVYPEWKRIVSIARYAMGIAAALLIVLFIWEQSTSVYKISKLETRIQSIQSPSTPGIIDRLTIQAAFHDKEWKEFWVSQDINHEISDPQELLKIRSMVEKRIRSGMVFKSGSGILFSNYLVAKKNILTFKNLIK